MIVTSPDAVVFMINKTIYEMLVSARDMMRQEADYWGMHDGCCHDR